MAFIVGYVNELEHARLEKAGYEVEDATDYNLIGESSLMEGPPENQKAVVIFIDCNITDLVEDVLQEAGV